MADLISNIGQSMTAPAGGAVNPREAEEILKRYKSGASTWSPWMGMAGPGASPPGTNQFDLAKQITDINAGPKGNPYGAGFGQNWTVAGGPKLPGQGGPPGGGGGMPYDPAANYNQPPPNTAPGGLPGTGLNLNPGGVNPYLNDPLSSLYHGRPNPMYNQQDDFYGDLQKFFAPSANP